jgi:glycosyltransferase involved in cell wall biosynthesis
MPSKRSIAYSLADQDFATTKSIGIWNLSMGLGARLAAASSEAGFTAMVSRDQVELVGTWPRAEVSVCAGVAKGKLWRLWWDQWGVYRAAARTSADWLFLPKGFPSSFARCPAHLALYVHDTIGEHYRNRYPPMGSRLENAYFSRSLRSALRFAQVIFTNSAFTADQLRILARNENIRHGKIVTAGIGFERNPAIGEPKDGSVLVLAGRFPHKLTAKAVDYMDRWQTESGFGGEVHWVGSFPADVVLPGHANWRRLSRLPDLEFSRLLARASVSVYFSEYEGFGMPPVEAALAGAAPVFSSIPATDEVMEGCGFPFENNDYPSFRSAMNDAIRSSGNKRFEWEKKLLALHDWERVVQRIQSGLEAE